MTLRPEYGLGHSEFNAFLFAPVGEDKTGLPLTVLSALSRLGLDPWGEAARLSSLPGEAAILALSAVIARLPEGDWKASDTGTIAARLIAFLPRRGGAVPPVHNPSAPKMANTSVTPKAYEPPAARSRAAFWLICLVVAIGWYMLVSQFTASIPPTSSISSTRE